ncbi:MAG: prepilin-type N-terminal cleavage/methylation domain-containing protein [Sulfuriferula sp.]|nr:prepilin-type N-terminal cleavage/methylation domain-containing protein [Sulfuriferula sp.]
MLKHNPPAAERGFTLIEAIIVIVITGIVASMVAVFIKSPVDSYFDSARRAALTDTVDTAVRRMARDIHLSLPNSVRKPADGTDQCIEFIPTKIGGRYRAAAEAAGGNILDFTTVDDAFDMLWPNSALPAASRIGAGDVVVVYNDGSSSGDAYTGSNAIKVAAVAEPGGTPNTTAITFVGTGTGTPFNRKQLPSESPANRFDIIPANEQVVSYACSGGALIRYSRNLTAAWPQPATCAAMTAGATAAVLAQNISACSLTYDPPGVSTGLSRFGIVSISLQMTQSGESVKLYDQIHIDNTP